MEPADSRLAEARSAQIARPEGVTRAFHVSRYKIDPLERACNLLSKHDCRAALLNEPEPDRPQVAFIIKSLLLPCRAERLAGAGTGPDRPIIRPSGAAQGVAPHPDPGEEMALCVSRKFPRLDILNFSLVDHAGRHVPRRDQVAQPCRSVRIRFIVERCHRSNTFTAAGRGNCSPSRAAALAWSASRVRIAS